jgi:hypothetical protein
MALGQLAGLGVVDAPVQRRPEEGLCFDANHAQLALFEATLRLNRGEQSLVADVTLTEVPAENGSGDDFSVTVLVLLEGFVIGGFRKKLAENSTLEVQSSEGQEEGVRFRRELRSAGKSFSCC